MKLLCRLLRHKWEIHHWGYYSTPIPHGARIECIRCGRWLPYSKDNYDRIAQETK